MSQASHLVKTTVVKLSLTAPFHAEGQKTDARHPRLNVLSLEFLGAAEESCISCSVEHSAAVAIFQGVEYATADALSDLKAWVVP